MNKILFITAFMICHWMISKGQIKITVFDNETQSPVAYAAIYYPDLKTGTCADSLGNAVLNVKQQRLLIQVSAVGYKTYLNTITASQPELAIYLEPSHLHLHEVVISTSSQKLQNENLMNVTSLKLNSIENNSSLSLPEKLATLPGMSQLSTGAGIGKPVIRGLSGNRVAVFSQGVRVENQQWGDEHGLGLDDNGYESVEIIKGPASLLYGSDALGGVLYFVDERYARQNSTEGKINSQFFSNTVGFRNNASFKLSKNNFHWNVFGGYTNNKDYSDGNNFNVPNSRFNTADLKTAFGFTIKKWTSALRYNYLNENYGLTEIDSSSLSNYEDQRAVKFPYQHLQTHLLSSENTLFIKESKLKINVGNVFNNRQELEEDGNDQAALELNLNTVSLNARWYSPEIKEKWSFIAGTQEMFQTNANRGEEILIPDATTLDIGFFGTAAFHYKEQSNIQAGLRFDNRTINGEQNGEPGDEDFKPSFTKKFPSINFSLGAVHHFKKYLSIRANLSSGFRAPNTFELLSNGVHEGTFRYEMGDISLKSENSYQLDASLNYESEHFEFFVNPFVNYLLHYIYLQPDDSMIDGFPVYHYRQTSAILLGGEGGLHFHPHPLDWLHIEVNYSTVFGNDENGSPLPLVPSQKINSALRVEFKAKKVLQRFNACLQHIYSFRQNRIAEFETETPGYYLLNAGIGFVFKFGKQELFLSAGVSNLLNTTYYDHLSRYKTEGIYNIGRNFTVGLSVPFEIRKL